MKVVVVTGGIGSGKSLVCSLLAQKGIPVYDSDSVAKRLYDTDPVLLGQIVELFGNSILSEDGKLDRKSLAAIVFAHEDKLEALEALVHPAVFRDFEHWKSLHVDADVVVYESALALKTGLPAAFSDALVYVDAPLELRVKRACARDGRTEEEIMARVASQSFGRNDPRVTYIIDNNDTVEALELKLASLYENIRQK